MLSSTVSPPSDGRECYPYSGLAKRLWPVVPVCQHGPLGQWCTLSKFGKDLSAEFLCRVHQSSAIFNYPKLENRLSRQHSVSNDSQTSDIEWLSNGSLSNKERKVESPPRHWLSRQNVIFEYVSEPTLYSWLLCGLWSKRFCSGVKFCAEFESYIFDDNKLNSGAVSEVCGENDVQPILRCLSSSFRTKFSQWMYQWNFMLP